MTAAHCGEKEKMKEKKKKPAHSTLKKKGQDRK